MTIIAQTERLLIRQVTENDASFILELVNTPAWYRFIGDRNVHSLKDAKAYLKNGPIHSYAENDFGSYCLVLPETDTPIGMCGLYKRAGLEFPDLGFALLPAFEGKGYAAEACTVIIRQAREVYYIPTLLAITTKDNARSIGLLTKLGFQPEGEFQVEGDNEVLNRFRLEL